MLSLFDWRLYESVEIISTGESFDFPEEEIGIDHQTALSQAWDLAKQSPINILRDKELNCIAVLNSQVVGALFDSWQDNEYSFDVIVSPQFQQQGIGKKLIDAGMSNFRFDSDGRENAYIKAEVANKNLIPLLSRMGFKHKGVFGGITVMTYGEV